jgi:hypothetical protein
MFLTMKCKSISIAMFALSNFPVISVPSNIGGGYFVPSVPVGDKRDGEFQNGEVMNNHVSEK